MRVRRSAVIAGTVGILLVAFAVVLKFLIVPLATRLPGDTDLTVGYEGTATLLDSEALQAGDVKAALRTDVPITVDRHVVALSTDGDTAVIEDSLAVKAKDLRLPASTYTYAVDRSTLRGVEVPAPAVPGVEPAHGALTSAFPISPAKDDRYTYYDPVTRTVVPVHYSGTDSRGGRTVNVYRFSAEGPVRNAALLKELPAGLPRNLVGTLAPLLPAEAVAAFTPAAVAALPDPVPMTFTASTDIVAYVDEQTGVAIDETIAQQVVAHTSVADKDVALLPVLALDFHITQASIEDLADTAASAGLLLTLVGLVAPLLLLVLGLLLVVYAVLRRSPPVSAGDADDADGLAHEAEDGTGSENESSRGTDQTVGATAEETAPSGSAAP
ncbi:Protein of unknown function (DUF3068) [Parafrankia irregularis]|uniref:DUF3068 domain-containing protein n=1 Tax=Parafrankia irregularis TaxID=795642 RepID=A0A0S4QXM3_9ACTN|nr:MULTISPECIES: porin PorA family protein [Parafrankia]MBE3200366.1 DUF3068 domain-containing protein [Parafrankia sp. CH37]CUU59794.1 Protein of unknown function (DUF3068) [Parafrankia irregularis]